MQNTLTVVLATLLAVSTPALAQQISDSGGGTARSILAVGLAETARLGRTLGAPSIAVAETRNQLDIWPALQAFSAGTRVRVTLSDGSEFEGDLVDVRTDAIVLRNNRLMKGQFRSVAGTSLGDAVTFQRSSVSAVSVLQSGRFVQPGQQERQPRTWLGRHPVLGGFVIGAGAGALLGLTDDGCAIEYGDHCPGINAAMGAGMLGGIGALIGLAF